MSLLSWNVFYKQIWYLLPKPIRPNHTYTVLKDEYAHCIRCFYGAKKSPPELSGPFAGEIKYGIKTVIHIYGYRQEIKIRYMDINWALYLLQLSSAQKWKSQHLKQWLKIDGKKGGGRRFFYRIEPYLPLPYCTVVEGCQAGGLGQMLQYMRDYKSPKQDSKRFNSLVRRNTLPI